MKKILTAAVCVLFCLNAFSQAGEAKTGTVPEGSTASEVREASPESTTGPKVRDARSEASSDDSFYTLFFTAGPMLLLNTDSSTHSAPSPIMFAGGIGADFFNSKPVRAQARLSFFTNYYFWDGEKARPAEVENRTATVLSFLLDTCAVYPINRGAATYAFGAGLGFLARYGVLSNGVESSDSGSSDQLTAEKDVSNINTWLWENMRFLYPELTFSYMHSIPSSSITVGTDFRFYIPLGSLTTGNGMDASLFSLAFKLGL